MCNKAQIGSDYMEESKRKRFVTTIASKILLDFKVKCTKEQKNMNEV